MTSFDAGTIDPPPAQIAPTAIIGNSFRPLLDGRRLDITGEPAIAPGVWIGQYTTVGPGVRIGAHSILEDYVGVQAAAMIGTGVLVTSRSWIGIEATVGDNCVIKGHIGDHSHIGASCRVSGDLIHRQLDPTIGWDDPAGEEPAPIVGDGAFVGWRAVVVGGVNIGEGAYVCAGALVTRDVPPGYIAYDRNRIVHPRSWPGALSKSAFFTEPVRPDGGRTRIAARLRRGQLRRDRSTSG